MRYARYQFSDIEKADLLKAWLATSVAFGLFFLSNGDGILSVTFAGFLVTVGLAAVTAGVGFIGHELMHKFTANRFGVHAEFRSNDQMLVLSIIIAFFGIIFAAPGAVQIYQPVTKREHGIISAAGPAANIVLAVLFLPLVLSGTGLLHSIGQTGLFVNALLGIFNLIPFLGFDGEKIFAWNKGVYAGMTLAGGILIVLAFVVEI